MAEQAHTPGTWTVEVGDHTHRYVRVMDENELTIFYKYGSGSSTDADRDEANGRLTAAAPDLLEALKHAVNSLDAMRPTFSQVKDEGHAHHDQVIEAAREAIAKATGAA